MDRFISALRERGVPEENLSQMEKDKIDQDVVKFLEEDKLSMYIPQYGDRIFAQNWKEISSSETGDSEQRKKAIIYRLREKMKLPSTSSGISTASTQSRLVLHGNKNAEKKTRKVELGWMNYQRCIYKQVRRATGGGTREIIVNKDETVYNILERAKTLFFLGGTSMKGKLEDFECIVSVTVSGEPVDGTVTVKKLYEQTNHKVLRLYLCTKEIDCSNSKPCDALPDMPCSSDTHNVTGPATHSFLPSSSPPLVSLFPVKRRPYYSSPLYRSSPNHTSTPQFDPESETSDQQYTSNDDEVIVGRQTNMYSECVSGFADTIIYSPLQVDQVEVFEEGTAANLDYPCSATGAEVSVRFHNVDSEQGSNGMDFFATPENVVEHETIVIRKAQCLMDMITAFSDENILDANISIRRVLERGEVEVGVGSGVIGDYLTDFWEIFYTTKTCGTCYKIPSLHHTFKENEWTAVARILAFGWQRFQFFPVQLAPPFLTEAQKLTCSDSNLLDVFFNYISTTEKDVLMEALDNFKGADMDKLLSILSSHNCSVLPTE